MKFFLYKTLFTSESGQIKTTKHLHVDHTKSSPKDTSHPYKQQTVKRSYLDQLGYILYYKKEFNPDSVTGTLKQVQDRISDILERKQVKNNKDVEQSKTSYELLLDTLNTIKDTHLEKVIKTFKLQSKLLDDIGKLLEKNNEYYSHIGKEFEEVIETLNINVKSVVNFLNVAIKKQQTKLKEAKSKKDQNNIQYIQENIKTLKQDKKYIKSLKIFKKFDLKEIFPTTEIIGKKSKKLSKSNLHRNNLTFTTLGATAASGAFAFTKYKNKSNTGDSSKVISSNVGENSNQQGGGSSKVINSNTSESGSESGGQVSVNDTDSQQGGG